MKVALSHDVDYPEIIKWVEILRNPTKSIGSILKESFWRFEEYIDLEKKYGMRSAFYFCGVKGNLLRYLLGTPDPFYDVRDEHYKKIIKYILECGFEVGMHASYLAWRSKEQFAQEKRIVEEACGRPIYGNRHHYWNMNRDNPLETSLMHKEIGLTYDSSIHYGFSNNCHPYYLHTLQLPVTITDTALFLCQKYDYKKEITRTIDFVRREGGVLVVDFHVRVLSSLFFPQWREAYIFLLEKISEDDFYCDTPINIARRIIDEN